MAHLLLVCARAVEAFAAVEAHATAPTGLLCEYQNSPALGVQAQPHFSWIVPPCKQGSDHQQEGYQVLVSDDEGKQLWDSGKVAGTSSTFVAYAGPAL